MKRCSLLAGATLLYCTAVAPGVFAGTLSYSCDFSAGGWNAKEWTMVTSPRFSHFGIWLQETDHIRNATPEGAANDELQGKKASETYTSMIYGKKVSGNVEVSAVMSFDYRMAPLIVLSDELGSDSAGRSEYRRHTEIVVYDQGINVWQHYYAGGKPSWVKLAWSTFELKPGTRYPVILKIAGQRIEITVDGHVLGVTNKDLPESYYVGLTGCEGINRFYSFSLKAR